MRSAAFGHGVFWGLKGINHCKGVFLSFCIWALRNLSDAGQGMGKQGWRQLRDPPHSDNREDCTLNGNHVEVMG
jgi:hypothetical protein